MGNKIDLKERFQEYLDEIEGYTLRSERLYDDLAVADEGHRFNLVLRWMEAAFIVGARTMAQDTLETLRDYGTAVSGMGDPTRTPTECFDYAADNLMPYYTDVLSEAEGTK